MHSLASFRRQGRRTSRAALALVCAGPAMLALAACSSNGDGNSGSDEIALPSVYAGRCQTPRTGIDPGTGKPFPDVAGNMLTEKFWVRSWINDQYLWYREVPTDIDINQAATVIDYFNEEKTPAKTASGKDKDQFHFVIDTASWEAESQGGVEAGYGIEWALLETRPPRSAVVAIAPEDTQGNTPGDLKRGAKVITVDGVDLENGNDVDTLNEGLFPTMLNVPHTFEVLDPGATVTRTVTLTSSTVEIQPVQNVSTIDNGAGGKIGYFLFTTHIATAEGELKDAIQTLSTAGVTDLILDMRYNGGGLLAIASELAYMIAGPDRTSNKIFETLSFNDKHTADNETDGFVNATLGFTTTIPQGTALPTLNLSRVFVLTGADTCSASESVMNSLAGVDVDVIQIGDTTCGKPYGFLPADNCGTTYFSIQFQGVNNKGFGDYADGFVPGQTFHGCAVDDDFDHDLGDPHENRIATALAYRATGTCPAATVAAPTPPGVRSAHQPLLRQSAWRQNRILGR